jgi:hypothetical protein
MGVPEIKNNRSHPVCTENLIRVMMSDLTGKNFLFLNQNGVHPLRWTGGG